MYIIRNIPHIIQVAALRDSVLSLKCSIMRIAISETIAKMSIFSNPLLGSEDKHVARDNRICLSAKYRK